MDSRPQNNQKNSTLGLRELVAYVAEILTISGAIIYGSGFVIVNAYLSQRGVSNVRLLHAAFVPPGILFFLLLIWAICLSSLSYLLFRKSVVTTSKWGDAYRTRNSIQLELIPKKLNKKIIIQFVKKIFNLYNIINFMRYILITLLIIVILGVGTILISYILSLASPIIIINPIDLAIKILPIMLLFAVFTALVGYNYFNWKKIVEQKSYYFPAVSVLVIIFTLLYSLYHVAGQIYDKLPPSIGGGAPEEVVLYVFEDDKPYFDAIGINLCQIDVEFVDDGIAAYGSNIIWWFWQFNDERRFGRSGDAPTAILYVTTNIENDAVIAIQGEKIQAIKFWPDTKFDRCGK